MQNDADEVALAAFLAGVRRTLELDRGSVRATAAEEFATERIADQVLAALERVRADHKRSTTDLSTATA